MAEVSARISDLPAPARASGGVTRRLGKWLASDRVFPKIPFLIVEGLFILVTLRLVGLVGVVGLITYLVNPASMAWASVPLPVGLRWTGVALALIAGLLLVWMFRTLGGNLTDTVVTRRRHTLVTTGPYRWVRHPLYSSAALVISGNSLVAANWFFFVAGILAFLLLVIRTRREEANLIARFGDDYRQYMQRTGRFVPRWPR